MVIQLIRQVRVLDSVSATDRVADVRVKDGVIEAIEAALEPINDGVETVIDGAGKLLLPGLVDLHSHSGEPGYESRETLSQLLQTAAAGGITRIGVLPSTSPPADTPGAVGDLLNRYYGICASDSVPMPQLLVWGALTEAAAGEHMASLAELAGAGIIGFADAVPLDNSVLQRRILEYLRPLDKPVMMWACDRNLAQNIAREGRYAYRYGLPGDPVSAEASALAALLEQVRVTETPVHLMQISTARGVELVADAKARGLPVTASTTWMHLLQNTRHLSSYDTSLRLAPPLGNPEDQAALLEGVQSGIIDAIAINHRAYTYEEKTVGFAAAPPGAIGLEMALSLLWHQQILNSPSPLTWVQALSTNPTKILQQSSPTIQVGSPAEMVLLDPTQTWRVDSQQLQTPAMNTPWFHQEIPGRVLQVWCPSAASRN